MKKLFCLTVAFLVCFVCNAQTNYYWSGGKKIWLDTDSTQMIIKFDNEQNLKGFISSISTASKLPAHCPIALVQQLSKSDDDIFQKLNTEKSIISKTFASKFYKSETPFYITGDILLQTKDDISIEKILDKFGIDGQVTKKWLNGGVVVRLNNWDNIIDIANTIYESGMVEWCHPDFATIIELATADPMFNQQYYLKNTGQNGGTSGIDINVEPAWVYTTSSNSIRVVVIDDGVEPHEDLSGRVLQGYTPLDSIGFGAPTTQITPGKIIGHGQACAGIIAASHNDIGIAGIAPNVQIVPVNIFHTWQQIGSGWFNLETAQNITDAIDFAWDSQRGNADVISNSWGYSEQNAHSDAIEAAINGALTQGRGGLGSVVVFASGNSHEEYTGVAFPARLPGVIAVGAVDKYGEVWNYSSRGIYLDVVALSGGRPGDIVTTDRMGANGYVPGNYYTEFNGTSAACPQVSGIAALILSVCPSLHQTQVRNAIESTCRKVNECSPSNPLGYFYYNSLGRLNGTWSAEVGYGLVNAYQALIKAFLYTSISASSTLLCRSGQVNLSVSNAPTGFTWNKSANLVLSSTVNSNISVTAASYYGLDELGWVSINYNGVELERQEIWIGYPSIEDITGPDYVSTSGYSTFTAVYNPLANISSYNWFVDVEWPSNATYTLNSYGNYAQIYFHDNAEYKVVLYLCNNCGCSDGYVKTVQAYRGLPSPVLTYPNPVDDILYIEIDSQTTNGNQSKAPVTYDIRLYDQYGILQRRTSLKNGKTQFDLSALPDGIYYLHIYDGVNPDPEMRQIVKN